eukprot:1071557-Rhodomonas_salina.6
MERVVPRADTAGAELRTERPTTSYTCSPSLDPLPPSRCQPSFPTKHTHTDKLTPQKGNNKRHASTYWLGLRRCAALAGLARSGSCCSRSR